MKLPFPGALRHRRALGLHDRTLESLAFRIVAKEEELAALRELRDDLLAHVEQTQQPADKPQVGCPTSPT